MFHYSHYRFGNQKENCGDLQAGVYARAPELLIFIADQYRNYQIAKEKNCFEESAKDMERFFSAFTDACITAQ